MSSLMQFLYASCKMMQNDKLIVICSLFLTILLCSEDYISRITASVGIYFILNKDWRI